MGGRADCGASGDGSTRAVMLGGLSVVRSRRSCQVSTVNVARLAGKNRSATSACRLRRCSMRRERTRCRAVLSVPSSTSVRTDTGIAQNCPQLVTLEMTCRTSVHSRLTGLGLFKHGMQLVVKQFVSTERFCCSARATKASFTQSLFARVPSSWLTGARAGATYDEQRHVPPRPRRAAMSSGLGFRLSKDRQTAHVRLRLPVVRHRRRRRWSAVVSQIRWTDTETIIGGADARRAVWLPLLPPAETDSLEVVPPPVRS
jgi:hypothetical protein